MPLRTDAIGGLMGERLFDTINVGYSFYDSPSPDVREIGHSPRIRGSNVVADRGIPRGRRDSPNFGQQDNTPPSGSEAEPFGLAPSPPLSARGGRSGPIRTVRPRVSSGGTVGWPEFEGACPFRKVGLHRLGRGLLGGTTLN